MMSVNPTPGHLLGISDTTEQSGDVPHFGGPTAMLVSGGQCRPDVATEA